jgi:hypothetical protein
MVATFCADRDVAYMETSLLSSHAQALRHLAVVGGGLASPVPAVGTTPGARSALTARQADFHRQLVRLVAELSDAAGAFPVRASP